VNFSLQKPVYIRGGFFDRRFEFIIMVPDVFLDQYRISKAADGSPVEMARNGPAITYKASDLKSGAPVTVTVVPTASIDPAERESFEAKARTATLLDHANIARTVASGATEDSLVFVSEYPLGETVEAWVRVNGPMPPDAVLRVAMQVVSALGAASFHGLNHPAIQPANLVIVTGKTAEGGWPLVKLTHFALSGLKSAPGHAEPDVGASDYASPEQLLQGKVDFRSEIYSLGATMCFLLTGIFYSAYPRSPQTKRFRGPLRKLVARMLEDDPSLRPQDPVKFTDELRSCLTAVERRQRYHHQYGFPLAAVVKKPKRIRRLRRTRPVSLLAPVGRTPAARGETSEPVTHPVRRFHPAWAIAACLLILGIAAAMFLPEDVVTAAFRRNKTPKTIGVPIGVSENPVANAPVSASAATPRSSAAPTATTTRVVTNAATPASLPSTESVSQSATPSVNTVAAAASAPAVSAPATSPPQRVEFEPAAGIAAQTAGTNAAMRSAAESLQPPASVAHAESASAPTVNSEITAPDNGATATSEASPPQPSPAVVAANNVTAQEPPPPAEAPHDIETSANEHSDPGDADMAETEEAETNRTAKSKLPATSETEDDSRLTSHKPATTSSSRTEKPPVRKPSVTRSKTISRQRVPRALPAEPNDLPPAPRGSFNARVVGVTPNGNVILSLPNGERAIVSPQDADH
jgi:serine/threonine protein kinase